MMKLLTTAAIAAAGLSAAPPAGADCTPADFTGHYVGVGNGAGGKGFHQALYCEVDIKARGNSIEFGGASACTTLPGNKTHRALFSPAEVFPNCHLNRWGTIVLAGSGDTILVTEARGDKSHAADKVDNVVIVGRYPSRGQSDFEITLTRAGE